MKSTSLLRNPLGTARATVAIATEANIPFDPKNFFPAVINPAARIADNATYPRQSQNPCPLSGFSPPEAPPESPQVCDDLPHNS